MALTQVKSDGIADGAVSTNDLSDSGVTAGTYGSSSAIPAITVDAKGRITSASTNSVTQVGGANGVDFNDNVKARFGTGNDLEIYHDGSNSYIKDVGTGILQLNTNYFQVKNAADDEFIIQASQNGGVSLRFDNNTKFETTSTGIDVTGQVTCDGMTSVGAVSIESTNTPILTLKDTNGAGTGSTGYIIGKDQNDADVWQIGATSTGNQDLYIEAKTDSNIRFNTDATLRAYIDNSGFNPGANNTYDLGTSSAQWRNGYFDGTVNCDGLNCVGDAFIESSEGILTLKDNNNSGASNVNYIRGRDTNNLTRWYVGHASNANESVYIANSANASIIFETNAAGRCYIDSTGHFIPWSNDTYDLGNSSNRWRNVYTNDLNLSNEGGANDVDGTWGNWTIQEGEDDLFLLNRRNGKKYKFNLSEVN